MIAVSLAQIKTRDGITLDGIYVKPKRRSKTALVWVHGLSSSFYSNQTLIQELSVRCQKQGIGYFKFNTRGHDLAVRGQRRYAFLGALYEKFEDCVYDIRAMVLLAKRLGYKNIILAGHSTGANKIVYYMYRTKDQSIKGLILIGGVSDITSEVRRLGKKEFIETVSRAKKLYNKNRFSLFKTRGFLFTAHRYISLHVPGKAEDVFPHYNPKAKWMALRSIRVPLAVIFGSREEHTDRPVKNLIEIFREKARSTKSFTGVIIKGAKHSFHGKEKELSHSIIRWVKEIEAGPRGSKRG